LGQLPSVKNDRRNTWPRKRLLRTFRYQQFILTSLSPLAMRPNTTLFRRLLPALLLASLALASCERCKDNDPRPRGNKCGTTTPAQGQPGGNS
jgi:hypothetical protein